MTNSIKAELMTPQQARQRFEDKGESIAAWADSRGHRRADVYAVLSGRIKGKRGKAHQIAVDLGIKPDPDVLDL